MGKKVTADEFIKTHETALNEGGVYEIVCGYGAVRKLFEQHPDTLVGYQLADTLTELDKQLTREIFHQLDELGYEVHKKGDRKKCA